MTNAKPYLISLASRDIEPHYLEAIKPLGDSVCPIQYWYPTYPGHLFRFDVLLNLNLDPERWWIFTDSSDVVFQKPMIDFTNVKPSIIVGSEAVTHINKFWEYFIATYPIFTRLKDETVYNAGVIAMPGHMFQKYIKFFIHFRDNFLPKGVPQFIEQLLFNMFVQENIVDVQEIPHLFTVLYGNLNAGNVHKNEAGIWVDKKDIPYYVVHKNADTKVL